MKASRGRTLKARVSLLERLEARKTRSPFVEIKQPDIHLSEGSFVEKEEENLLEVETITSLLTERLWRRYHLFSRKVKRQLL